ncbi:hypothetical protein ACHAXR_004060 [Thalassiosira sp. AJA248-18]
MFGPTSLDILKGHLVEMVKTESEEQFDHTAESARALLASQSPRNGDVEDVFEQFVQRRLNYASYEIKKIPGNGGRHGNQISEANHSSVLSFLNDNKGKNTFCAHPNVLIRELLKRQSRQVNIKNLKLFGWKSKLKIELTNLRMATESSSRNDLMLAVVELNYDMYKKYKNNQMRSMQEYSLETATNAVTGQTEYLVHSIRYPKAPPRIFSHDHPRCDCLECIQDQSMCVHEIKYYGGFKRHLFLARHFARDYVTGSLLGWVPPPSAHSVDDLIGYCDEHVDDGICGNADQNLATSVNCASINNGDGQLTLNPTVTAPGQIISKNSAMKALDVKYITNIFSAIRVQYPKFSMKKKDAVGGLVMKMEEILTFGNRPLVRDQNTDYSLHIPDSNDVCKESQKRTLGGHEKAVNKSRGKVRRFVQNIGLSQNLTNGAVTVVANAKDSSRTACSFCGHRSHKIPDCDKRRILKMTARECILTTNDILSEQCLKERMKTNVRVCLDPCTEPCLSLLPPRESRMNIIIDEVRPISGQAQGHLESMISLVRTINADGDAGPPMWVTGAAFNSLITHQLKKIYMCSMEPLSPRTAGSHSTLTIR